MFPVNVYRQCCWHLIFLQPMFVHNPCYSEFPGHKCEWGVLEASGIEHGREQATRFGAAVQFEQALKRPTGDRPFARRVRQIPATDVRCDPTRMWCKCIIVQHEIPRVLHPEDLSDRFHAEAPTRALKFFGVECHVFPEDQSPLRTSQRMRAKGGDELAPELHIGGTGCARTGASVSP